MIDSQSALQLVDKMAAMSAASAEDVAKVKEAIPAMVGTVEAGGEQQHIHTGMLNATVRKVGDQVVVRINATTPGGRSKMDQVHLS